MALCPCNGRYGQNAESNLHDKSQLTIMKIRHCCKLTEVVGVHLDKQEYHYYWLPTAEHEGRQQR